jgi:flagellar biosynthesis/type III secretory pathway protein FliH
MGPIVVPFKPDPRPLHHAIGASRTIIDAAHEDARKLREETRENLARLLPHVRARTRSQARKEGIQEGANELLKLASELQAQFTIKVEHARAELIRIALLVAEQVIGREAYEPSAVAERVDRELTLLLEQTAVQIRISPEDSKAREILASRHPTLPCIFDDTVSKGGAKIDTVAGQIEIDLNARMDSVRGALLG